MGREAHIKNSSDGGRLPAGHGTGGIKAFKGSSWSYGSLWAGLQNSPNLDVVLRRCNPFHFISFRGAARLKEGEGPLWGSSHCAGLID